MAQTLAKVVDLFEAATAPQIDLPNHDNTPEALKALRSANEKFRVAPWPSPFGHTDHELRVADSRSLAFIPSGSVHLVVTSPPYWTLKQYNSLKGQMGAIEDYEQFLDELDKVWAECKRALAPGGRICCVVGDVCVPRKRTGKHFVVPLHADIQVRARRLGLDILTPILWHKIANGVTEVEGNGAGFYGKPYQPNAIVKNDIEHILFMRKGGEYRKVTPLQRALSMLTKDEMQRWWRSVWTDIRGASTRSGHPAPYPNTLAERLIRMFSFAGDTVLDPFAGTGSTAIAAVAAGRNSISVEIDPAYADLAASNILKATATDRKVGAVSAHFSRPIEKPRRRRGR
ncbi:MAG TPA: site-specific DNA-methyltransferase [Caulobacterales bacterium]|nr:site-specific DNA-methyltransferase [Caulobacterales bacterium]